MSWAALVLLGNRSSLRIQDEPVNMRSLLAEVEHVVQRARDRIGRAAAGPAETAVQGSFLTVVLAPRHFFAADNPAATVVIRSLILLGARRDGGYLFQDLFQDCNLPRDAPAVRNACLASDSWPAD